MKRLFLRSFITLLLSVVMSFSAIADNIRHRIDMGNGVWRFSKELNTEHDMSMDQISVRNYENNGKKLTEFVFETKGEPFKILRMQFSNGVEKMRYTVESSNDGFKSDVSKEFVSPKFAATAKKFTSDVSDIDNTVGFVKKIDYHYVENFVNSSEKKQWRVTVTQVVDANNKYIQPELQKLLLISSNTFEKSEVVKLSFDDSAWETTGVPHSYNDMDTYLNVSNAEAYMWQGDSWYRRKFTVNPEDMGKRFVLEFQGVSVGAAVYVNGHPFISKTDVEQPDDVTNVGCALPFSMDITDYIKAGSDNILAVRVSNAPNSFYTYPGFGVYSGFGMGWGGIVAPVYMHVMDPIHIAPNVYSLEGKWGTYISTMSVGKNSAKIRSDIQICNDSEDKANGTIITKIYDNNGKLVQTKSEPFTIGSEVKIVKNYAFTIENPTLWYPNNSPYGFPAIYKMQNELFVDGKLVDVSTTDFGIRVVEWDDDYCYVNHKKHFLKGFGYRNSYPGLGAAVPNEVQWRDVKYMADAGANLLRVGHIPATTTMLEACDYYGIMLLQNSGDNEWTLKGEPISTYKFEYDNQMIVSQRNHPSIIVWESNNGIARGTEGIYGPERTLAAAKKQDYLSPRLIHNRDGYPHKTDWKSSDRIMVGYTNGYRKVKGSPTLNTEVYGAVWNGTPSQCIARFEFDYEKTFAAWYVKDYLDDIDAKACGWIDWMLAETQGEGYTIYLNGRRRHKSLGSSSMDGNRFPKLKYHIYEKALWVDYETRPGVALQTNWNLEGTQEIDAWSNCKEVELFVGKKSYGRCTPDPRSRRCTWKGVEATAEELRAVGYGEVKGKLKAMCEDVRQRAGEPYAVRLSIEKQVEHPNGQTFYTRANGSDAVLVIAEIVDKRGVVCNLADNNITFEVEGEGSYKGSYNFYIAKDKDLSYHAPGDPELQAEGGLMKVAVRSTLTPGKVVVKASSKGLKDGEISFVTK